MVIAELISNVRLSRIAKLSLEVFDVLHIGFLSERQTAAFDASNTELQAILGDHFNTERLDMRLQLQQAQNTSRTLGLENGISSKNN